MSEIESVVIGGSAGAIDALLTLLPLLPDDFDVPVVVIVHLAPDKPSYMPEVLGSRTRLRVKEAEDKEPMQRGHLYVAPPNYHLLLERDRTFSLSMDAPLHFSRPSIDVTFDSAADVFADRLVGVLLSGANEDGAAGLARIADRGGTILIQRPSTATALAMPEAALAATQDNHVLSPAEIGTFLGRMARSLPRTDERR